MIGRQVIKINKPFTFEELAKFMEENWDTEQFSKFKVGKQDCSLHGGHT